MRSPALAPGVEPSPRLQQYFDRLLRELGPQKWWPARTRFEVILGAILTQNTSWQNAAQAMKRLRKEGLTRPSRLKQISRAELETLIHSAGFFRQKAKTIRNFLDWLESACHGSLASMFRVPPSKLRHSLLAIQGLGPETVDAVLLYAGRLPFFVADAYTRRILERHGLTPPDAGYVRVQEFVHQNLPRDHALFNEFHALLVEIGKRHCKRAEPRCAGCPLEDFLPGGAQHDGSRPKARTRRKPSLLLQPRPTDGWERDSQPSFSEA